MACSWRRARGDRVAERDARPLRWTLNPGHAVRLLGRRRPLRRRAGALLPAGVARRDVRLRALSLAARTSVQGGVPLGDGFAVWPAGLVAQGSPPCGRWRAQLRYELPSVPRRLCGAELGRDPWPPRLQHRECWVLSITSGIHVVTEGGHYRLAGICAQPSAVGNLAPLPYARATGLRVISAGHAQTEQGAQL